MDPGSTSLDEDDGLRTDWGDLDIKYVKRDNDAFDNTKPPGFSGATTSRNIFFMAVAGIGYSVAWWKGIALFGLW